MFVYDLFKIMADFYAVSTLKTNGNVPIHAIKHCFWLPYLFVGTATIVSTTVKKVVCVASQNTNFTQLLVYNEH